MCSIIDKDRALPFWRCIGTYFTRKASVSRWWCPVSITVTPHERHGALNRWQVDCLSNSSFRQTTRKILMLIHYEGNPVVISGFPSKNPVMQRVSSCHVVRLCIYSEPVYNDHLMGYFSAFWSSSRWPMHFILEVVVADRFHTDWVLDRVINDMWVIPWPNSPFGH